MVHKRREQQEVLRDFMSALAVCNNVTPVDRGPMVADLKEKEEVHIRDIGRRSSFAGKARANSRGQSMVEEMRDSIDAENDDPQLEASSPDEVALVKFGYQVKMKLMSRERRSCSLINIAGKEETFDILCSFPFTSESKKMGTLLKSRVTGRNIYYLKGAEIVMEHKISVGARPSLLESCENLAMEGLRTLVFA